MTTTARRRARMTTSDWRRAALAVCCLIVAAAMHSLVLTSAAVVPQAGPDNAAAAKNGLAAAAVAGSKQENSADAAAAANAASDTLLHLTSANWTAEISKGSWMIEFYSPYCAPCRGFASTWQELNVNKQHLRTAYPQAPFVLAQVDCNAQTDLCIAQGVKHMPRLTVYREGKQITSEFQGNREYTELSAFIDSSAAEYRAQKGVSDAGAAANPAAGAPAPGAGKQAPPAPAPAGSQPTTPFAAPQQPAPGAPPGPPQAAAVGPAPKVDAQEPLKQQPVPVPAPPSPPPPQPPAPAPVQHLPPGPNPLGVVLQFGKDELVKDLFALRGMLAKDSKHGATFIKFFAPWCPHCRAMAGAYRRVAENLKGRVNVVEVDCEENKAICRTFSITSFPTLRMYNEGESSEYGGSRTAEPMTAWALKAGSAAAVRDVNADDLSAIARNEDIYFLYLHSLDTPQREIDAVTQASRALLTTPVHVYRSSDAPLLEKFASQMAKTTVGKASGGSTEASSGLFVFKDHDANHPTTSIFPNKLLQNHVPKDVSTEIGAWLDRERYPTVIELTAQTFTDVLSNRQGAPVVLAAVSDVYHSGRKQGTGTGSTLRDEEVQALHDLALQWRKRKAYATAAGEDKAAEKDMARRRPKKVLFAWINADRWATALKKYYKIKATEVPRLVLADGARLEYYDLPSRFVDPFSTSHRQAWLEPSSVFESLDAIWQGRGPPPKSSRTYLDRGVQGTASVIEDLLIFLAQHIFLTVCVIVVGAAAVVSLMRRQVLAGNSRRSASQRLPQYGAKSD